MEEMTLERFEEAAEAVGHVTSETKLVYSEYYSAQTGNKVYFKPENMQYTGAYKVRGAYYKISTMSREEDYGFCGESCAGCGLRGEAGRSEGYRGNAHDDTSD